ncbi:hypothetical protein Hdeb2414_s0001g00015641 [Helianthus debilis subsp. tardiflorus]
MKISKGSAKFRTCEELELQGIACFLADRSKQADPHTHETADRVKCSVTFGVVVVTKHSLLNHIACEDIRFFAQKKNLIPVLEMLCV